MEKLIIAPSVLSMDYSRMNEQLSELREAGAEWLHFDVMDGHFVPNLTFGPDLLKGFRKASDLYLDVHLMVEDPEFFADVFADAGADMVTFHTEAFDGDMKRAEALIRHLHEKGVKAGVVIKPKTPVESLEPVLPLVDMVLVMSVEPGFGGQSFMPDSLPKVEWLDEYRKRNNLHYRIEIDGGINEKTAGMAKSAGADTLVAGSYVFKNDIKKAVSSLR